MGLRIVKVGFHVRDDVRAWMSVLAGGFFWIDGLGLGEVRQILPFQTDRPSRARVGNMVACERSKL